MTITLQFQVRDQVWESSLPLQLRQHREQNFRQITRRWHALGQDVRKALIVQRG